ncbi:MAG: homoserine dehydrogenase [Anaerolineae bacterium]|nr:homoserine dehydrogenase [Anaerolineae bacterium]
MSQKVIPVILLGLGNVGSTLLRQIIDTQATVARRKMLHLVPIGLADISGVLFDPEGLSENTLQAVLHAAANKRLLDTVTQTRTLDDLETLIPARAIVADVTASTETRSRLQTVLAAGGGVVLANKNPLIGSWQAVQQLFGNPMLRYECAVGAGLPVIDTLHYLLDTGDQVHQIEGCMSGTLGYLCAELERGIPYSQIIAQAREQGYTEPDPRDDLSGHDVARKALILARTAGWPLEMTDLAVEALYDESLVALSTEEFMAAADTLDAAYANRFRQARAGGHTLRYVAQVGPEGGTVKLRSVPQDSPLGTLRGPANYIALRTQRYADLPLVISGPGAGPEVTAAGVLGDMIKLAQQIV